MLTPGAAWTEAANRASSEPRILLTITDGLNTWKALSGYSSTITDAPIAVLGAGSVASEVDPLTREMSSSEAVVDVADAWIRPIIVANRLKGQQATLKIGFADISELDYLAYFSGPIEEITPSGGRDSGVVTLSIMDMFTVMQNVNIIASWFNRHHLQIMYDGATGKSILSLCGYNSGTWVNETSFAPSSHTSISHWVTSRIPDFAADSDAFTLVSGLCKLLNGQIVCDEEGKLQFKRFDASAAIVDTWTADDIVEGSIEQEPLDQNVVNRVTIKFGKSPANSDHPEMVFTLDDADSQAAYAYPGQTTRLIEHVIETEWCPSYHAMPSADIAIGDTSIKVLHPTHALSGTRDIYPSGSPPADGAVSASRPVYLWIDNGVNIGSDGGAEIVKAEAATADTGIKGLNHYFEYQTGTSIDAYDYAVTYSSITRGQLGTSARAFTRSDYLHQTCIWDITPLVDIAQAILARCKYGCPIVSLATPISKMPVQQGDLVSLVYDAFLAYGLDGVTTAVKFEVIGKEPDPIGSPAQVRWKLAYAGTESLNTSGRFRGRDTLLNKLEHSQSLSENSQSNIQSGFVGSAVSGLNGKITKGGASSGPIKALVGDDITHTFTASKDTYVAVSPRTGEFSFYEVANGASAPSKQPTETWVAKFVTNGSAITSVDNKIKETLPVDYDKVKDGSTWKKVTGVSSANQVQTSSVAKAAVGVHQSIGVDRRASMSRNLAGMHRTRG